MIPQQCATTSNSNNLLVSGSQLSIAQNSANNSSNSNQTMNTNYYYSAGQLSPSCNSVSSVSSFDSNNSPNTLALAANNLSNKNVEVLPILESSVPLQRSSSFLLSVNTTAAQQQISPAPTIQHSSQNSSTFSSTFKTIVIKKGPQGYGFTIQSVRVYLRFFLLKLVIAIL